MVPCIICAIDLCYPVLAGREGGRPMDLDEGERGEGLGEGQGKRKPGETVLASHLGIVKQYG